MNTAQSLVPPRPNLGPEPWASLEGPPTWPTIAVGIILVSGLIGWRWMSRRRRVLKAERIDTISDLDSSPVRQLILASDDVRASLIAVYGPSWASRTTEEIATDSGLVERVGEERAASLIAFLRMVDRSKFADEHPQSTDEWSAFAASFVEGLASAGARSRRIGK